MTCFSGVWGKGLIQLDAQYESVSNAVERCAKELGAIDFVM